MGLFSVGLRLHSMAYLGFADGLFGLHYLRFIQCGYIYGFFGSSLCLRLRYIVPNYGWFGACLIVF